MINAEKIANQVVDDILKEENMARKKVVVYAGRFQPFHKGHYKTYKHLIDKFGSKNVYIGTSNKISKPRSPFSFREKKEIMTKMFNIPSDKIVQIKNPYAPKEILRKFNKDETAYIAVIGQKDRNRLGGSYFEDYKDNKDLLPYEDKGYVYVSPSLSDISGTQVRKQLGEPSTSKDIKEVEFKRLYGKFDKNIFDLVTNKLTESVILEWVIEKNGNILEMAKSDVKKVDNYADKELDPIDVDLTSKHFFERLNDPRNGKDISTAELIGFFKRLHRNKKQFIEFLKKYNQIVVTDNRTNINIPFMKKANKAIAKTIMRKNNFKTSNVKLTFENKLNEVNINSFVKTLVDKIGSIIPANADLHSAVDKISLFLSKLDIFSHIVHGEHYYEFLNKLSEILYYLHDGQYTLMKAVKLVNILLGNYDDLFEYADDEDEMGEFDRVEFYEDYVKNLVPENFDIKRNGDTIEIKVLKEADKLKGGLADNMSLSDIADKHNVSLDDIKKQLKMGIKVELEHVDDKQLAAEIARDHLVEDPKYYTKLKKMEKEYWEPSLGGGLTEDVLLEGGAYGHMNHPFDLDINLTFGDLKKIVDLALEGKLKLAREKTDGMALAISWRDDKGGLIAARNKSHLKNSGKNAMDIDGVKDKFSGRGGLTDAYTYAMKDLSNAISKLSDAQREKIFQNGSSFMNIEVIYPESTNVIPYGQSLLVFHGTMQYDEDGNAIGENQEAGRILAGMIKQINQDVQEYYNLQGPPIQKLPKSEDLSNKKSKYLKAINKLENEFNLKDGDGVSEYHQAWWENWVEKNAPKTLDNRTKMTLVKRWAFFDKSNRLNGKTIPDDETLQWAKKIDKQQHDRIAKQNLRKFETVFLSLGAEILSYMSSVLTVNPDEAVQKIKNRLDKTIKDIRKSADESKIDKLEKELKRLQQAGGTEKLVPNEGIVFVYKGHTLKLTGTFAPLNQILGLMYH